MRLFSTATTNPSLTFPAFSFLRAEPAPELVASLGPLNYHIHSVVAELLQVIISRGEAEIAGLQAIESALTSRLFLCIHRSELDLQNKLLHVLHSVVHAVSGSNRRHHKSPSLATDPTKAREVLNEAQPPDLTHDAMFVRVVSDAISTQENNAVIHHWIDFLLMTIPQFRQALHSVIFPLVDCLVIRLRSLVQDFKQTYAAQSAQTFAITSDASSSTDAEYTVLVNALERLLLIAVTESLAAVVDEEPKSAERPAPDASSGGAGGLLGYMSGVLGNAEMEAPKISDETRVSRRRANAAVVVADSRSTHYRRSMKL